MDSLFKRRDILRVLGLATIAMPVAARRPAAAQDAATLMIAPSGGDDTAAIRAVLAAPGAVHVNAKPGIYNCSDQIVIPPGIIFDCQNATFRFSNILKNGFVLSSDSKLRNARVQSLSSAANDDNNRSFETCNGVMMKNADRAEVRGCTISGWMYNGVFERDCHDFIIAENTIHSGRFSGTGADINCWSLTPHYGGRITDNSCLSNNSQGIYVVSGTDEEIIIDRNRCLAMANVAAGQPLVYSDPVLSDDGTKWMLSATEHLRRRHGIVMGYDRARRRALVSGNTIRRTTQTGIYCTSNAPGTGSIHVINNIISDTGRLVGPTNGVMSAITMQVQGEGDLVGGNQIENHIYAGGAAAGISVQPGLLAGSEASSTLVTGNTVKSVAGAGIMAISCAQNVTITDNQVSSCGGSGVVLRPDRVREYADTMKATGNRVIMPVGSIQPAIVANPSNAGAASQTRFVVDGNILKGQNKSAFNLTNAGIHIKGQANFDQADGALISVTNNMIEGFSLGLSTNFYMTTAPKNFRIDNNRVTDCTIGLAVPGVAGSGARLIATGNLYKGCSYAVRPGPLSGQLAVWEGALNNGAAIVIAEAAPTTGSWSAGDQIVRRPAVVGEPKGWRCTVSGVPGIWVSDGIL